MRWTAVLIVLLVAHLAILLPLNRSVREDADLVFVSPDEHNYLDPQKMSWLHDLRVAECMFETLVRFKLSGGPEMEIEPAAAERWEVSEDGLTYTFHLRRDARWSNGDPLRASDFVYAWRRALSPDLAADYSELLFRIKGAEEYFKFRAEQLKGYSPGEERETASVPRKLWEEAGAYFKEHVAVATPDERTLVVTLEQPTPYFLELCAFMTFTAVHEASVRGSEFLDESTGMMTSDATYWSDPDRVVCNGPFVLKSRRFKQDLLLERNEHYWNRANVKLGSIRERIIADPQTALMVYENGRAHWLPEIPSASSLGADLVEQKRPDVHATPWAGTYFYNLNCMDKLPDGTPNPLRDPRVRRALSMGIDRQTIVDRVTRLGQPIARSFIPPGSLPGYESPVEAGATFDPDEAKRLLAAAGYESGSSLTGLSILYNNSHGHASIAQQIKRSWEQHLGVVVTLEGVEGKNFSQRLRNHQFTIARASWIGDYRDPTTFLDKFRSDNGNNDAAYKNPRYDQLMASADAERDPTTRLGLLRDAEALMLSEQPIAPIYHYITLNVFDPNRVRNMHLNMWNFRRLDLVEVVEE